MNAVTAATLVTMAGADPDFPDPAVEARWIADQLKGAVMMVPDSGHYPQAQRPGLVAPLTRRSPRRCIGMPRAGLTTLRVVQEAEVMSLTRSG